MCGSTGRCSNYWRESFLFSTGTHRTIGSFNKSRTEPENSTLQPSIKNPLSCSAHSATGVILLSSTLLVEKDWCYGQLEPTSSWALLHKDVHRPSKYTGMLQATKDIFREEGLRNQHTLINSNRIQRQFFPGTALQFLLIEFSPFKSSYALLMVMPYIAIQFTMLDKFKTFVAGSSNTEDHIHLSPYLSYVSGAIAGCAATVGSYPFDLIRTILASQGEPKHEVYMPNLDFLEENDDEVDLTCHTLFLLVHC